MDIDTQLLNQYARTRDADAFTQLVRRHAGMVFAVARRVTQNHHDAEEVAQSCFMELARQPATIHGSLPGWLHGVATNQAIAYNRTRGRRRRYEQAAARPEAQKQTDWDDVAPLVDAALAELPDEIRLPMLLYHFQGLKQYEVAAELGVSPSTISHRLEAGVAALREKLKAAGVLAPSVALPALLTQHAVEAVPKSLMMMLGRLAVSGFTPAAASAASGVVAGATSGGGSVVSGGTSMASGTSSVAAKGTAVLGLKVMAAVVITAAVTTAGVTLLPRQQPVIAVSVGQTSGNTANDPVMSGELKDVLERLKTQEAQGWGDGVTILTLSRSKTVDPHPRNFNPIELQLYAQQGESQLYMRFLAGHNHDWGNPKAKLPDGWPTPDLNETLRFADQLRAYYLQENDGHTLWSPQWNDGHPILVSSQVDANDQNGPIYYHYSGYINYFGMPSPSGLAATPVKGFLTTMELIRRPPNPSLLGLHFTQSQEVTGKSDPLISGDYTYWMDPGRNDVPVEQDSQYYDNSGKKRHSGKFTNKYLEYAQLPDGRWYSTYWQEFDKWGCTNYQAAFYPGKTLDAKWFGNPAARFAGDPGNPVLDALPKPLAAAAKTITTDIPKAITATTITAYRSAWWWWPWALAVAVFGTAGALLIWQRRNQSPAPALRGSKGPRRR